jgi:site-specific DNA recombinase
MRRFFAYVRVSTAKQGEHGVSLQEQRSAIEGYASRNGLQIIQWFEERETAAKRGRPVFTQMLKLLRQGKADGLIVHKIDRSARNLRDWADLGELIDQGIEVQFANEGVDLNSRGGRLSADIQAVVAADYIRNLREETRKGFYGRLKQGVYPLPAPIGYRDMGAGRPKEPDPMRAPLVRKAFELYASGGYNLHLLREEISRLGLRNRNGGGLSITGLSVMLNNPFYIGLIRLKRTRETFAGSHQPLISRSLFERVQAILHGKTHTKGVRHTFLFRRLLRCARCEYSLRGELHKGHIYYRCHTRACPVTCVREEQVDGAVRSSLERLTLLPEEARYVAERFAQLRSESIRIEEETAHALRLREAQIKDRISRLTDAYLDGVLDKSTFEGKKAKMLMELQEVKENLRDGVSGSVLVNRAAEMVELAGMASFQYEKALPEEKRDLLQILTSNRRANRKDVVLTLFPPFQIIANRFQTTNGAPYRDIGRTWDAILSGMVALIREAPSELLERSSEFLNRSKAGYESAGEELSDTALAA